ncbi:Long chain acyl-CoA synthetase 1-like protein [Drosera capensis]
MSKKLQSFSVQVEDGKEGGEGRPAVGPMYRNLLAKNGFPPPDPELNSAWDSFRCAVEKYPGNRMLGWRPNIDGKFGPYTWKTYKQVYDEVLNIGSALRACGAEPGARIGIYGPNCPEWIIAMEACNAHSLVCVPLYDTLGKVLVTFESTSSSFFKVAVYGSNWVTFRCLHYGFQCFGTNIMNVVSLLLVNIGPGAVDYIIGHAEIDFVFAHSKKVAGLLDPECSSARRLKSIICFTSMTNEDNQNAKSADIEGYSWSDFIQLGNENPHELFPPQPFNICTIMYTSGTSGDPKGVVLTHENIAMTIRGLDLFMEQFEDKMTVEDVFLSFLPLAHILDRAVEEYFFHKGASVGYYHGNLNELKDDLMELKPTFFAAVPRVLEKVKLYWMNLGYKQKNASPLADLLAFRKVKARLGGRVRLIVSGAAPLGREIEEFLRVTCCCFVLQGYGLTETCGLTTIGYPDEMSLIGTVGASSVYSEMRLEEVPEMDYHPLADPPRGEICVRGKTVFSGYYKNPELTRETFRDGWFHTGDIGEMQPNGTVKIIDRKKNLIKLSQGEYVALEYLEKVYAVSPIVEDIWVYGNSFKSMLVAIVVLNEEKTMKWAEQNAHKGSLSGLAVLDELKQYVLSELKAAGERNKLRGFEFVKGVILDPKPFEVQDELLTPTMKKRRDRMLKRYQAEIDGLYQTLSKPRV